MFLTSCGYLSFLTSVAAVLLGVAGNFDGNRCATLTAAGKVDMAAKGVRSFPHAQKSK
jgi:hypothetical protein